MEPSNTARDEAFDRWKRDAEAGISRNPLKATPGTCNCDFHQGHWGTQSLKYTSEAKYHTAGSPVRYPYCTGPGRDVQDFAVAKRDIKTGFNCSECRNFNEYAVTNQVNGTYICFNCRC